MTTAPAFRIRDISDRAVKFLDRRDSDSERIQQCIGDILKNPYINSRHLKGKDRCNWRRRVGRNRIIFSIDQRLSLIDIIYIGPRDKAYR